MKALLIIIAICLVLDLGLSAGFVAAFYTWHDTLVLAIGAILAVLYVVEVIVLCFFWYRAWKTIQDPQSRTGPGKAVGLMFIPLFNLYWAFVMVWGFAKDYNAFCRRHRIESAPRLPGWYFLTVVIMWIVLVFLRYFPLMGHLYIQRLLRYKPTIGVIYGMCFSAAMLVLLYKTARAVLAVRDHKSVEQTPSPLSTA